MLTNYTYSKQQPKSIKSDNQDETKCTNVHKHTHEHITNTFTNIHTPCWWAFCAVCFPQIAAPTSPAPPPPSIRCPSVTYLTRACPRVVRRGSAPPAPAAGGRPCLKRGARRPAGYVSDGAAEAPSVSKTNHRRHNETKFSLATVKLKMGFHVALFDEGFRVASCRRVGMVSRITTRRHTASNVTNTWAEDGLRSAVGNWRGGQ